MSSILQTWVTKLGLRHQGVLVTAMRGCDGIIKEDATKPIIRELRGSVLVPFDVRELVYTKGFMTGFTEEASQAFECLKKSIDHYPTHYITHLMHAMEVVGYCHPKPEVRKRWRDRYFALVRRLHLNPETSGQMHARLKQDRVARGIVEG